MLFVGKALRLFPMMGLALPLLACADFQNKCWPPIPHRAYEVCPQYDVSNAALRMSMNNCVPGTKRCIRACGPEYDAKQAEYQRCLDERRQRAQEGFVYVMPPKRTIMA